MNTERDIAHETNSWSSLPNKRRVNFLENNKKSLQRTSQSSVKQ